MRSIITCIVRYCRSVCMIAYAVSIREVPFAISDLDRNPMTIGTLLGIDRRTKILEPRYIRTKRQGILRHRLDLRNVDSCMVQHAWGRHDGNDYLCNIMTDINNLATLGIVQKRHMSSSGVYIYIYT